MEKSWRTAKRKVSVDVWLEGRGAWQPLSCNTLQPPLISWPSLPGALVSVPLICLWVRRSGLKTAGTSRRFNNSSPLSWSSNAESRCQQACSEAISPPCPAPTRPDTSRRAKRARTGENAETYTAKRRTSHLIAVSIAKVELGRFR
ncbi:Protein of unknown function [Pyronema omphalodes CBS 100304]|uniref:Uncharacterized protein n=1 Tax=Pyronema omphalodes (strain CBS 100304) TaxID=1076935 RepID=U4LFP2_PYROM|nr:Protein of unknown function [Pyronema omphalodes CBS 100304]